MIEHHFESSTASMGIVDDVHETVRHFFNISKTNYKKLQLFLPPIFSLIFNFSLVAYNSIIEKHFASCNCKISTIFAYVWGIVFGVYALIFNLYYLTLKRTNLLYCCYKKPNCLAKALVVKDAFTIPLLVVRIALPCTTDAVNIIFYVLIILILIYTLVSVWMQICTIHPEDEEKHDLLSISDNTEHLCSHGVDHKNNGRCVGITFGFVMLSAVIGFCNNLFVVFVIQAIGTNIDNEDVDGGESC